MEAIVTSVSTADVEDPEALLNVWLGELDNLTLVSANFKTSSGFTLKRSTKDG